MTNTLHRYGKSETFVDDYIVFSLPAKSKAAGQTGDALAAQKRFMQIAAEYKPASLGDALHGGSLRIRSTVGSGTIVRVHLPFEAPAPVLPFADPLPKLKRPTVAA